MSATVIVTGAIGLIVFWWLYASLRFIPNSQVGIVEKLVGGRGLTSGHLIALDGQPGFQPEVLRGGLHFLPLFLYRVHLMPLVTIQPGRIGYVFARDGQPLGPDQMLASNHGTGQFTDVRAFLRNGGQQGPQRQILREGTYAMNLAQFVVVTDPRIEHLRLIRGDDAAFQRMAQQIAERHGFQPVVVPPGQAGIVTVHDGPSIPPGDDPVGATDSRPRNDHDNFQDADRFLAVGGCRGRQSQTLTEGTYYINRLFATVEMVPATAATSA